LLNYVLEIMCRC